MTTNSPARNRRYLLGSEARIALAAIVGCLALVLGLRLISKDAPSAGRSVVVSIPTPVVSTNQGCANFAKFWMDSSGVGVTADVIEDMTNCRRAADGSWFVPTGPNDRKLVNLPILTDHEATETAALEDKILADIDALESEYSTTLQSWLKQLYDPFSRSVVGHIRDGYSIRTARNRYTRLTQSFLMDPERKALADYVGWIMAKRIDASDSLQSKCLNNSNLDYLNTVCENLPENLNIRNPPFTWDLKKGLTLNEYLASTLQEPAPATPAAVA